MTNSARILDDENKCSKYRRSLISSLYYETMNTCVFKMSAFGFNARRESIAKARKRNRFADCFVRQIVPSPAAPPLAWLWSEAFDSAWLPTRGSQGNLCRGRSAAKSPCQWSLDSAVRAIPESSSFRALAPHLAEMWSHHRANHGSLPPVLATDCSCNTRR